MCDCIKITYLIPEGVETTIEINVSGTFGGANYYYWTDGVNDFYLFWNTNQWEVSSTLGGFTICFIKDGFIDCPDFASIPAWQTEFFSVLQRRRVSLIIADLKTVFTEITTQ